LVLYNEGVKIIIDARELRTSTGRYMERLLHYLQLIDRTNDYIVLLKPSDMPTWQSTNRHFTKLSCPYPEFSFSEQIGLAWQLKRLGADLVHFGMVQQPVLYGGRTVTTIHDLTTVRFKNPAKNTLVFTFKQQVYKLVIKRACSKSRAIIVPSEFVKKDLVGFSGIDPAKIRVTYEAADRIDIKAVAIKGLAGERFIMYIGRPTPHKNLERLIEAFVKLRADHPDLVLVLAGRKDANYRRIEAGVYDRQLSDCILFTDFVSEGQLRWLYENCAAYVFPSLSEGFGLPGLEAMVHGAPLVSSNATCLPEIYGQAAHYFDPLDTTSMVQAINDVLSDEKLRQRLISAGRDQVKTYSWNRLAKQTLEVYEKALKAS